MSTCCTVARRVSLLSPCGEAKMGSGLGNEMREKKLGGRNFRSHEDVESKHGQVRDR
jgi:hypothetical protein